LYGRGLGAASIVLPGELGATGYFEHGALKGLRQDKDPEIFLRTLLMHVGCGHSLRETSTRVKQAGLANLSDVAILKRLRKAEGWLHALCSALFAERLDNPMLLEAGARRRLRIIDGSLISEPGQTGSTWRLHYSMGWPSLVCDFFELTPGKGKGKGTGETLSRYPVQKGDHLLGDRGFCSAKAIHHVVKAGADVTIRLNPHNIRIYAPKPPGKAVPSGGRRTKSARVGKRTGARAFDWVGFLSKLDGDWSAASCVIDIADKNDQSVVRGRICALRKSREAIHQTLKKLARRKQKTGVETQPETELYAEYVLVFTTLPENEMDTETALALYRLRWQVELVFKRFKQLASLSHLPKTDPASSQAVPEYGL